MSEEIQEDVWEFDTDKNKATAQKKQAILTALQNASAKNPRKAFSTDQIKKLVGEKWVYSAMQELLSDGLVERNTTVRPYVYRLKVKKK